ncbi:hypothetical protein OIU74_011996 [Salix koriyanagi]|uniref:Uncharacterized protein n=1 Tax=Salix koriyanagi TaxID=2511006 RepID=A0A9Q0Q5Q3_9ROSI|nr:hypothetical protein OIU74_011996 [Salix koriyanagi]
MFIPRSKSLALPDQDPWTFRIFPWHFLSLQNPTQTPPSNTKKAKTKIVSLQDINTKNVVRSGTATSTSTSTSTTTQDSLSVLEEDQENNVEERFSMKLRRNPSVSSSASALQSAVKKAFSMGRSTSVSARYCMIHSQCIAHP